MHPHIVADGSAADGTQIADLDDPPEEAWISLAVRDNPLLPITSTTELRSGDELTVLADKDLRGRVAAVFTEPTSPPP